MTKCNDEKNMHHKSKYHTIIEGINANNVRRTVQGKLDKIGMQKQ